MKKIPVDIIENGMVLAKDVCGPSGNVLLTAGTKLTPSLGRRLKNWGNNFVTIQSDEAPSTAENAPNLSNDEEIRRKLTARFSNVMDNAAMKKIFDAVLSYKIQKGAQKA
jgi:hypothetical protein